MARRVFFSFHYQRDIWRVNVVRNSWVTQDREVAGFWDASLWEEVQTKGEEAITNLIDNGLQNSSVTVVLIGAETHNRKWVRYEIIESYKRGNGLLGVYIHNILDNHNLTDIKGPNPFDSIYITQNERKIYFSELYPTYDWKFDNGYTNFATWIENAARAAGR